MSNTPRSGERYAKRLSIALVLIVIYAVVQVVAAFATGSLSLLSDAGHMGTDALGLAMALAAIVAASRARRRERQTFGLYRLEIIAALANSLLLLIIAGYALVEGFSRLSSPGRLEGRAMLFVALGGLVVNLFAAWLLRDGSKESLNVEGAYTEVLADLLSSIGVVVAAVIYLTTGWAQADPIVAILIGLWIIPRAFRLGWKATSVLIESAPADVDVGLVSDGLGSLDGVVDVHDLHVWTLTSGMDVATAHLVMRDDADSHEILDAAGEQLRENWGISHATLQVEPVSHSDCIEETW
jgi:cobalt-zinc-cadmium efflux system protein